MAVPFLRVFASLILHSSLLFPSLFGAVEGWFLMIRLRLSGQGWVSGESAGDGHFGKLALTNF